MAQVTIPVLSGPGFRLTATFDDVTEALVSYRGVIDAGVTVEYELWRSSNRQPWRSGTLAGPVDETFQAGGPIQNISDIGHMSIREV